MKKIIIIFFVTLGVLFLMILALGSYLFIVDPYHIKSIIFGAQTEVLDKNGMMATTTQSSVRDDKNPLLNETQEKALEKIGVDPATLPTQITPEQEACFIQVLGIDRVTQIKAGDLPTAAEFFKARSCL